jgi:biotin operon repressor
MTATETRPLVTLFKALGDSSRLKILGLLAHAPQSVEAIAATLHLSPPTVSHHLARLKDVGLVTTERDQYYQMYRFCEKPLTDMAKALTSKEAFPKVLPVVEDPQAVLRPYMVDGRLTKIPSQRKKRVVVLEFLANQFQRDQQYTEKEVNATISAFHDDFCTLRRELIMAKLLDRAGGGGTYWRTEHDQAQIPSGNSY